MCRAMLCEGDGVVNPTIETYNHIAGEFADRNWDTHLDRMLDAFVRGIPSGGCVLDLGCGPGRDVALLAERGFQVVGMDLSIGMLQEAQRRGVSSLGLVCADMRSLPVARGAFDGVWASASLLHLERAEAPVALSETARVLRSRGRLYLSVKLGDGQAWDTRFGQRFFTYYQPDEVAELVNTAGFHIEELQVEKSEQATWINVIAFLR